MYDLESELEEATNTTSHDEARMTLRQLGTILQEHLEDTLNGTHAESDNDPSFNLRARLRTLNREFVGIMEQKLQVHFATSSSTNLHNGLTAQQLQNLIKHAETEIEDSTGPKSMMSPDIVKRLYNVYTKGWPKAIRGYLDKVGDAIRKTVQAVISHDAVLSRLQAVEYDITLWPTSQLNVELVHLAKHCVLEPVKNREFDLDLRSYSSATEVRVQHMMSMFKKVLQVNDMEKKEEENDHIARALNNCSNKLEEIQRELQKERNVVNCTAKEAITCMIWQIEVRTYNWRSILCSQVTAA